MNPVLAFGEGSDDLCVYICTHMSVSVIWLSINWHSGFHVQPRARIHGLDYMDTGRGGVLRHVSTSLTNTECGLGVHNWFMTCRRVTDEAFRAGRSLGCCALNWQLMSHHELGWTPCCLGTRRHNLARVSSYRLVGGDTVLTGPATRWVDSWCIASHSKLVIPSSCQIVPTRNNMLAKARDDWLISWVSTSCHVIFTDPDSRFVQIWDHWLFLI